MYKHGTYQRKGETRLQLPVTADYGHFIVGIAPMNKVSRDKQRIN